MKFILGLVILLSVGSAFADSTLTCTVSAVAEGHASSSNPLKLTLGETFIFNYSTKNGKEAGLLTLGQGARFVSTNYRSTFDSQWIDFSFRADPTDYHPILMRLIMVVNPFDKFFAARLYHRMDGGGLPSANLTCTLTQGPGSVPTDPWGPGPQGK